MKALRTSSAMRVIAILGLVLIPACSRDVRLAGKDIPTVTVQPVTHYGITLDENATPEQVAFVALTAIREDFLAEDDAARNEALDVQFSIAAANEIQARNRTSMSRDEFVYNVVYRWTPTVAHYVDDFPTDWASAEPRLHRRKVTMLSGEAEAEASDDRCEVAIEVADPGGDPNAQVVLLVWLAKDKGLWRVTHLGFDPKARSVEARR